MLALVLATTGCALAASPLLFAQATQPNPIVAHYKAYAAALQRNDLPTAETEATAALAASQEKYGDGGRTAVLAMNLAAVRLQQGQYEAAAAPARKAVQLVEAGGAATGVDIAVARLALARAELRTGGKPAFERLEQALEAVAATPGLATEAYAGAIELAAYAMETQRYGEARKAWVTAGKMVRSDDVPDPIMLAQVQLGEAIAGILEQNRRDHNVNVPDTRIMGGGVRYAEFDDQLVQVINATAREASLPGPSGQLTRAQGVYAQSLAWRSVVAAKLRAEDRDLRTRQKPSDRVEEIGGTGAARPPCDVELSTDPAPVFPLAPQVTGGVGSVVVKFRFDESGKVEHWVLAAAVGGPSFSAAITDVAPRWRLHRKDPSKVDCRLAREVFQQVTFVYD